MGAGRTFSVRRFHGSAPRTAVAESRTRAGASQWLTDSLLRAHCASRIEGGDGLPVSRDAGRRMNPTSYSLFPASVESFLALPLTAKPGSDTIIRISRRSSSITNQKSTVAPTSRVADFTPVQSELTE